ncbi:hypothetical protein TNCV_3073141 [Trichonephila clavipes]|nr:hypothetical protein TNCV_3073141 [Trichonephila clavipes]
MKGHSWYLNDTRIVDSTRHSKPDSTSNKDCHRSTLGENMTGRLEPPDVEYKPVLEERSKVSKNVHTHQ